MTDETKWPDPSQTPGHSGHESSAFSEQNNMRILWRAQVHLEAALPVGAFRFPDINSKHFKDDRDVFNKAKSRRLIIRPDGFDVDYQPPNLWFLGNRPTLYVAVFRLSDGLHFVQPIWRGDAFWHEPESDTEAATAVAEAHGRGGCNVPAWDAYIAKRDRYLETGEMPL